MGGTRESLRTDDTIVRLLSTGVSKHPAVNKKLAGGVRNI